MISYKEIIMKDKKTLLIRLDANLHKQMRIASIENEFSLNSFVNNVFKEYLVNSKNKSNKRGQK